MYSETSRSYTHLTWVYLNIPEKFFHQRYDWVAISLPNEDRKYPWAHEYNIVRLFLFSRTFNTAMEASHWINSHLTTQLLPIHQELVDHFCYSESVYVESVDELIEKTVEADLLGFIHLVLERALLWYKPDSIWPGDFNRILWNTNKALKSIREFHLKLIDKPEIEGVYLESAEPYTHVFYKFQNLMNGIEKGELYYDIKDLAKQAHDALIQSMLLFFSKGVSALDEIAWERKMTQLTTKEMNWCKMLLFKERA